MIFDKHANLKYKYGNRHFWCRGYYVATVGRYEGAIKEYIRNQLQEDIAQDTLNFKEYTDPFTGGYDLGDILIDNIIKIKNIDKIM